MKRSSFVALSTSLNIVVASVLGTFWWNQSFVPLAGLPETTFMKTFGVFWVVSTVRWAILRDFHSTDTDIKELAKIWNITMDEDIDEEISRITKHKQSTSFKPVNDKTD